MATRKNHLSGKPQPQSPWLTIGGWTLALVGFVIVCLALKNPSQAPPAQPDTQITAPMPMPGSLPTATATDPLFVAVAEAQRASVAKQYAAALDILERERAIPLLEARLSRQTTGSARESNVKKALHDALFIQAFATDGLKKPAQEYFTKLRTLYGRAMSPSEMSVVLGEQGFNLITTGSKVDPEATKTTLREAIKLMEGAKKFLSQVPNPPADVKAEQEQKLSLAREELATVLATQAADLLKLPSPELELAKIDELRDELAARLQELTRDNLKEEIKFLRQTRQANSGQILALLQEAQAQIDQSSSRNEDLKISIKFNTALTHKRLVVHRLKFRGVIDMLLKGAQDDLDKSKDQLAKDNLAESQSEMTDIVAHAKTAETLYREIATSLRASPDLTFRDSTKLPTTLDELAHLLEQEPGREAEAAAFREQAKAARQEKPKSGEL